MYMLEFGVSQNIVRICDNVIVKSDIIRNNLHSIEIAQQLANDLQLLSDKNKSDLILKDGYCYQYTPFLIKRS